MADPINRRTTKTATAITTKPLLSTANRTVGSILGTASVALLALIAWKGQSSEATAGIRGPRTKLFTTHIDSAVARKKRRDFANNNDLLELVDLDVEAQLTFLKKNDCREGALQRYLDLRQASQPHIAQELWKYCALYQNGGIYLDAESPLLFTMDDLLEHRDKNVAVLSSQEYFPNSIHGSLLSLKEPHSMIAKEMLDVLVETPIEILTASALLLPRKLHALISTEKIGWRFYETRCSIDPLRKTKQSYSTPDPGTHRLTHHCPTETGYCCQVFCHENHSM